MDVTDDTNTDDTNTDDTISDRQLAMLLVGGALVASALRLTLNTTLRHTRAGVRRNLDVKVRGVQKRAATTSSLLEMTLGSGLAGYSLAQIGRAAIARSKGRSPGASPAGRGSRAGVP